MRPADPIAHVRKLHASFEARTGFTIRWNMHRERQWSEWCAYSEWEWTEGDLARVIAYLRNRINNKERNAGALKFDNLIGNPPGFEEDLNLAREAAKSAQVYQPKKPSARPDPAPGPDDRISAEDFRQFLHQKP